MVAELNIGVVGVGARSPLALYAEDPKSGSRIVSVADPSPHAPERIERFLGRKIPHVISHREWDSTKIDAAFILSPDDTHAAIACDLLEAKIAIYLEKPLAITASSALKILETAQRTKTPIYVGHNMRHMSVVRILRNIIEDDLIGEVQAIWCRHFVGNGGDYYFRDWHADQRHTNSLLLQKGAHDIDIIHYLSGAYTIEVTAMGRLAIYGDIKSREDNSAEVMNDWISPEHWPPRSLTGLNPIIDVEDISMMLMQLDSGGLASYQQCHFSPDYWRNYTIIGDRGRAENFGDGRDGIVRVWNKRLTYDAHGDYEYPIDDIRDGHLDADQRTVQEFLNFIETGQPTETSTIAAWQAVAAGAAATESLRSGAQPVKVSTLPIDLVNYFNQFTSNQRR